MKISFCTTCMGRAHHLKETLPQNIRDNPASGSLDVEFVVLNYNSEDDLHEWMTTDPEMLGHIESGLVRYGKTTDPEFFHMAHAKNMAHRMATGDVICNLDADNFTGKGFSRFLSKQFSNDMDIVISPSHKVSRYFPPEERGFAGRIAVSTENYFKLGGYDETLQGWGGDDNDFTQRAKGLGLKHLRYEDRKYVGVIAHTNEERAAHMDHADEVLETVEYRQHGESAIQKALRRIEVFGKPVQANHGTDFGMGRVSIENDRDRLFAPVLNDVTSPFNVCALGLSELVRGRISPRMISDDESPDEGGDHLSY